MAWIIPPFTRSFIGNDGREFKMLLAIHYCRKEQDQARALAAWIKELGPYPNHKLLVARDRRADEHVFADLGFQSTEEITITDDVWDKWCESPNNAFRHIAKHIEYGTKEPWLWCEADAIPLSKDWLDKIEAEYQQALRHGKVFLGDFVHIDEPGFLDHCSGVAVYPGIMSDYAGEALLAHEVAWDITGSAQILPRMHKSKLILHRWKYPAFESWEQVEKRIFQVKPDCVLFHSDKNMSLIPLLREKRKGGDAKCPPISTTPTGRLNPSLPIASTVERNAASTFKPESAATPICDIFIKSFPGDYEWLKYCLRSINKFATGFRRTVIVSPDSHFEVELPPTNYEWQERAESGDGYLFQQVCKLNADKYTDAGYVLFMDSDCVFTRPISPETFMSGDKPIWLMTPMDKAREDQCKAWLPVMTKWMNKVPKYEFMHRHPFMFPRWFFEKIRTFCANQHGMALDEFIMSQPHRAFSEFNCAGFLAYEHFRDRFEWINTETDQVPEPTVLQNWSPGGLTEGIEAELERILKGGDAQCNVHAENEQRPSVTFTEASETDSTLSSAAPSVQPASVAAENPNIKQTKEGIWVLVTDSHISRWVEEKGTLAHDGALSLVLNEINQGDIVIDAGAFIGDSTASFLERVGLTGKVLAFEPNMDAWECLRRNCPRAISHPFALGAPGYPMLELTPEENAGARYLRKFGFDKEKGYAVHVATLDSLGLKQCDFVKCDAEGFELHVLKGAEQTINRFHPKLLLEVNQGALRRQGTNPLELYGWLKDHGYDYRIIQPECSESDPQYDILCKWIGAKTESCSTATASIVAGLNGDSREAILRDAVALLKQLCTSPVHTGKVRKELRSQGVIK